ncbi:hypothetical protein NC652_032499 [Populus alba x Populus x berolinensis]|nr:hypothetical protein NC652_032499 [Populus alba x Populus x berolinensis]
MSETLTVEKTGKGEEKARTINRERFISKIFLRGDSPLNSSEKKKGAMLKVSSLTELMKQTNKMQVKILRFSIAMYKKDAITIGF